MIILISIGCCWRRLETFIRFFFSPWWVNKAWIRFQHQKVCNLNNPSCSPSPLSLSSLYLSRSYFRSFSLSLLFFFLSMSVTKSSLKLDSRYLKRFYFFRWIVVSILFFPLDLLFRFIIFNMFLSPTPFTPFHFSLLLLWYLISKDHCYCAKSLSISAPKMILHGFFNATN